MEQLFTIVKGIIEKNRKKKWMKAASMSIACLIVFATTYSLILPAITISLDQADEEPGFEVASIQGELLSDEDADGDDGRDQTDGNDDLSGDAGDASSLFGGDEDEVIFTDGEGTAQNEITGSFKYTYTEAERTWEITVDLLDGAVLPADTHLTAKLIKADPEKEEEPYPLMDQSYRNALAEAGYEELADPVYYQLSFEKDGAELVTGETHAPARVSFRFYEEAPSKDATVATGECSRDGKEAKLQQTVLIPEKDGYTLIADVENVADVIGVANVRKLETAEETAESAEAATEGAAEETDATDKNGAAEEAVESVTEADTEQETESITEDVNGGLIVPLTYEGEDYSISLTYGADAEIPEDAYLDVCEIEKGSEEYQMYLAASGAALENEGKANGTDGTDPRVEARFFDITIMSGDQKVEPKGAVSVDITYHEALPVSQDGEVNAVHFEDGAETATVLEATPQVEDGEVSSVSFDTESFSVFGIVYTVDFHWEVNGKEYEFSLPGGGFVNLEVLMEVLGVTDSKNQDESEAETEEIETSGKLSLDDVQVGEETKEFVNEIEKAEFSDPDLVWVGKVERDALVGELKEENGLNVQYSAELMETQIEEVNAQMVEAGDWALISVQPFTSEETLTVTMKNGEVFTVRVTDGQVRKYVVSASGDTYEIIVTYDDSAEIPEDADLEVREILPDSKEYTENIDSVNKELDATDEPAFSDPVQFDISIVSNGVKVEPKEGSVVNVEIRLVKSLFENGKANEAELEDTGVVSREENGATENNAGMIFFDGQEIAAEEGSITECKLAHIQDDGRVDLISEVKTSQTDDRVIVEFETDSFSDYMVQNNSQYNNGDINKLPNEIYVGDVIYFQGSSDIWVTAIGSVVTETKHNDRDDYKVVQAVSEGYFRVCHRNDWQNGETWAQGGKVIHVLPERTGTTPPRVLTEEDGIISNSSIGLSVNLFDYDLDDYLDDRFNNYDYAGNNANSYQNNILSAFLNHGINNGHNLKFWGSGITNGRHGSENNYDRHGVTSIVASNLSGGIGGYPKLSNHNETLEYLFSPSDGTDKKAYTNADGLFRKVDDYYIYNSNENYAVYDESTGSFKVYDGTYEQKSRDAGGEQASQTNGKAIGFFPFHPWDDEYDLFVNWNKNLNHHFGMSMSVDFALPQAPKAVKDTKGNDIVFHFSGDDDMWVFIDGKLAMDIGGIHQPTSGTINFTKKEVSVTVGEPGHEYDQHQNFDFDSLYDGQKHTLQVFYIERGGCDSNCLIQFNITRYGDVVFEKVDADDQTKLIEGATFGLYKDKACTIPLMENLNDGTSHAFIAESDADGKVNFTGIPLGTYYLKEIWAPDGYPIDSASHTVTVYLDPSGRVKARVKIDDQDVEEFPGVKITNKHPDPITLGLKKDWENTDSEAISIPDGANAVFELKRIRSYEHYEEKEVEGETPKVSKLTVGWIHNEQEHTYKEYTLISGTRATITWGYKNGYSDDIAYVYNGTTHAKESVSTNIYSETIIMPEANGTATFYIVDNSEFGESISGINVAGSEFIGNSGGGVIHEFTTVTEPDPDFHYEDDPTNVVNNRVTLPIGNSWEYNFTNLPLVGSDENNVYTYSYYLEEVSIQAPTGTTTVYRDTEGHVINTPTSAETSESGTLNITNKVPTGYLRIDKSVTYNGISPVPDEKKSALAGIYRFKIYTDSNCSKPYKVIQGEAPNQQEIDLELTVTIGDDGVSKSSETVKIPVGDYWIEEQTPSQTGVTPEENRIKVTVTADQTTEEPAIASFTNNKEESDSPDELTIELEKTFTGLPNASKIPANYQAALTYKIPGSPDPVTVPLTGSTAGHVTCTKSEDGMVWHWRVTQIPKDATDFGVYESYYDIDGYTRITKINGVVVENPGTPQTVTVLKPEITMTNPTSDYTTTDDNKVFTVEDNQILLVRMTNHATVIVSQKSLSLSTRQAIEKMLQDNGGKIPGDNGAHAQWVMNFVYFSHEIQGDSFSYGGRTIFFEGNKVKIPHKSSSHEVRVDIGYTSTSAENSFTIENIYTEIPTKVDVLKVEKGNETTIHLPNAVFELRKLEDVAPTPGGTLTYVKENDQVIVSSATTGSNGRLTFPNLTYGVYEIRELTPPPGYIQTEDVTFYLRVDGGVITYVQKGSNKPSEWTPAPNTDETATVYFLEAQEANPAGEPATEAVNATFRVGNTPGAALPGTGGPGTRLFTILGSILILGAGVLLWRRRRLI